MRSGPGPADLTVEIPTALELAIRPYAFVIATGIADELIQWNRPLMTESAFAIRFRDKADVSLEAGAMPGLWALRR